MLLGLNEELERVMGEYRRNRNGTEKNSVFNMIAMSLAAGDDWYIPVEMMQDGENETDYSSDRLMEKLPRLVKREVITKNGTTCLCAFTSLEKVHADGAEALVTVRYPAAALLREFLQADSEKAIILNPWADDFMLNAQECMKLLSAAAAVSPSDILHLRRYSLEPRTVIDIQEILDAWDKGWNDSAEKQEKWEYLSCPIMADGRILLLFESCDRIYGGKNYLLHVDHEIRHYRVLEYAVGDDGPKQLGKYRFMLQDGIATTVLLYDGILKASVRTTGSEKETILPMVPANDDGQFKIYENVRRVVGRSDGSIAVGYYANLRDESRLPMLLFSGKGEIIGSYRSENALFCADLALDSEEHIWFHLHPSAELVHLAPDTETVERHGVVLQDFDAMALNKDRSKLFLSFGDGGDGNVHYILSRNQNGNYTDPVLFQFPPNAKNAEKSADPVYPCSTMKSWVCIQAGRRLYLYDINDLD